LINYNRETHLACLSVTVLLTYITRNSIQAGFACRQTFRSSNVIFLFVFECAFLFLFLYFVLYFIFFFYFLHISLFRFVFVDFVLLSLVSFYIVFISLISFRFVSFLLISFRFVSFLFRFALYRCPVRVFKKK
jgi:hypothetical protein